MRTGRTGHCRRSAGGAAAGHDAGPATNLQRHTGGLKTPPPRRKSPQQGAATSVLLATSPQLEGIGGRYFEDCAEAAPVPDGNGWSDGVAPYALDPANAQRLWEESLRLLA